MLKVGLLIRKLWLISIFMMSETRQQIFTINILLNKDNQTMKFGQLLEYSMRNILFLENYTQYFLGKLVSDPLIKTRN